MLRGTISPSSMCATTTSSSATTRAIGATAAGGSQDGLNAAAVPITVTYTDGDADTATSAAANVGNQIRWEDDGPTVSAQLNGTVNLEHDETVGDDPDADDVLGTDFISGGSGPTIASLFDTEVPVADQGDDPDVPGSAPLGFARVDFLFAPDGSCFLNEVTLTPGNAGGYTHPELDMMLGRRWSKLV